MYNTLLCDTTYNLILRHNAREEQREEKIMKRRTLKSIVCAAVMALALSITACGSGGMTLEKYYNDNKSVLDAAWSGMGADGMEVAVDVTGNEFAVTVQITDSAYMIDGIGEALSAAADAQADMFKEQAAEFDEALSLDKGTCTVSMRYLDPDGNVLAEKSYKAD